MSAIPLRIQRTFYIDSRLPPDAPEVAALALGPPLRRVLPGGAEPHHVYQVGGGRGWVGAGRGSGLESRAGSSAVAGCPQSLYALCTLGPHTSPHRPSA